MGEEVRLLTVEELLEEFGPKPDPPGEVQAPVPRGIYPCLPACSRVCPDPPRCARLREALGRG